MITNKHCYAGTASIWGAAVWLLGWGWTLCGLVHAEESPSQATAVVTSRVHSISPGADVQFRLQQRLIEAVPGDVIQLEEGTYELRSQLDVVADNVTIRGRGSAKTILTFRGQTLGGQGIEATGNNFVLEGLAVQDTAGNGVKILGAKNVTLRDVRAEWTGPPTAENGAYGLYPVQCQNVLMEDCSAFGASDAGLYVGQCHDVVVRRCRAERNVAGIEIENTVHADVYDNTATNNTGGILVFDLPGLQVKAGDRVRVYRNHVLANNHANFADPGSTVAAVPPGTGVMVLATDRVEIFENQIDNNQTASVLLVSYLALNTRIHDPNYDPISEKIVVQDNRIRGGGRQPSGMLGELLKPVLSTPFPDILWDGVLREGAQRAPLQITRNGDATFVNFRFQDLSEENVRAGKYQPDTSVATLQASFDAWHPVELTPHDPPSNQMRAAVQVYRSLPIRLSEWGLFVGDLAAQKPAADVMVYELNAALFSDYAHKQRFLRLPSGTQAQFHADSTFTFPVGTVIAKTFAYPHDLRDPVRGSTIIETRIEFLRDTGWYGVAYRWNDEQTDATLDLGGSEVPIEWIHHDGQLRQLRYQIPNANQCLACHNQDKAFVPLGTTARNLNRTLPANVGSENQLEHMVQRRWLSNLPTGEDIDHLPQIDQADSGTVEQRARAWLDVNCAHCHSPLGTARTTGLDLRWHQRNLSQLGLWKRPTAAGHGSGGLQYDLVPGDPDASILVHRIESTDSRVMMPNLGRQLVHQEGVKLVRQWIKQLPPDSR